VNTENTQNLSAHSERFFFFKKYVTIPHHHSHDQDSLITGGFLTRLQNTSKKGVFIFLLLFIFSFMLTRRTLAEQPNPQKPSSPDFKKTNVVLIDGVKRVVTAKLQGDGNSHISYSTCTLEDLKDHQHGKPLH
jgi:hypothetical protein